MLSQSIDVVVGGKGGTKLQVLISKLHYKKCACGRLCGVWCGVCGVWCVCGVVCVVCGVCGVCTQNTSHVVTTSQSRYPGLRDVPAVLNSTSDVLLL